MFALIILIAIGIDYGVYMHKTTTQTETKIAIKYALLSTLAGFGVLIFSDTVALYSIGFVITVGVGAIFILLWGTSTHR
jgi:predicted exporter